MNALLVLAALTGDANAWSHTEKVWARQDLPFEWWMGTSVGESPDYDYAVEAIGVSMDTWIDSGPCANLSHSYAGVRENDHEGGFVADGINTYSLGDPLDQLEGSTLAATLCLSTGEVLFTKDGSPYRRTYDCDVTYSETVGWAT